MTTETRDPVVIALLESEETWHFDDDGDVSPTGAPFTPSPAHYIAAARIAACAPELARRWLEQTHDRMNECRDCACPRPEHTPDCETLALLEKLGVQ